MLNKIKMYYIFAFNFVIFAVASLLMKFFPSKELKFRKLVSKLSINSFISEIELIGDIDENVDMFISNHQNMVDIPIIEYILPSSDLAWVAKKELGDVFLFGNLLIQSDAILIQREDKKSLIELLKSTKDRINKGKKIVIFPEGTRNKNPKKLLKFKPGAKLLAEKYNFNIQPLLLLGIDEIVKFHPLEVKKGKLTVIALPSRKVQKGSSWYEDLEKEMQEQVDKFYKN
jgi:1-acyl-sn-glycerol-3-phosphate acyltransferase